MKDYIVDCPIECYVHSAAVLVRIKYGRLELYCFYFKKLHTIGHLSAVEPFVNFVEFRVLILKLDVNLLLADILE